MDIQVEKNHTAPTEREITLKSLVRFVVRKWRLIIILTLAIMIIGSVPMAVRVLLQLNNTEFISAAREQYDNETMIYTNKEEALENEIALITDNLDKQKAYYENSLLMKIDPYQKKVGTLIYYINSGYQIIPENTYQNIDYSSRLIKTYIAYLNGGEAHAQLMTLFPEVTDEQYIREIMTVSADYGTSMITITVVSGSDDTAAAMQEILREGMNEAYDNASSAILSHELTEINAGIYTSVDLDLAGKQQANFEQIYSYNSLLQEKNLALQTLKQTEGEPVWEYSWQRIATRFVKNALMAAVFGLIAALLAVAVYYLSSDKLLDVDKLQSVLFIRILGCVPRGGKKRRGAPDRSAVPAGGVKFNTEDQQAAVTLAARNIHAMVLADGTKEGKVALVGSVGMEALKELAMVFNGMMAEEPIQFEAAGNPLTDGASVALIRGAILSVMVERQGVSLCSDVVKERNRILSWGKPVLGVVVLDADAGA